MTKGKDQLEETSEEKEEETQEVRYEKRQEGTTKEKEQQEQGKSGERVGEEETRHQNPRSEVKIGFGRYMRKTYGSIYKEDPDYCE